MVLYSRQETAFQMGFFVTSKCRCQICASTLWVKSTFGVEISQGITAPVRKKSQTITS